MSIAEIITTFIAVAAFLLSCYNFTRSHRRKQRKLINAVYYHVVLAIYFFKKQQKNHPAVEQKINSDESYTPYIPQSSHDDLTYDHIIDAMEWLDSEEEEEKVLYYFHYQLALHALATSFQDEHFRNLSWERRKAVWNAYKNYHHRTLKYAEEVKTIMESKKS